MSEKHALMTSTLEDNDRTPRCKGTTHTPSLRTCERSTVPWVRVRVIRKHEDLIDSACDQLLVRPLRGRIPHAMPPLLIQRVLVRPQHLTRASDLCRRACAQALCLLVLHRRRTTHELGVRRPEPGWDVILLREDNRVDGCERGAAGGNLAYRVLADLGELEASGDAKEGDPVWEGYGGGVVDSAS